MKMTITGLVLAVASTNCFGADNSNLSVQIIDTFEKNFGITEGKRRNHTKGFCFEGTFNPVDPTIKRYSNSPLFKETSIAIGRLSHKGGNNSAPDNKPGEHGMGLLIRAKNGEEQRMAMNTLDFFPVATPEGFLLLNKAKSGDAQAKQMLTIKHPEILNFKAHMAKKTKNIELYENMHFNSINSFYLTNEQGKKTPVRWSFEPTSKTKLPQQVKASENFLFANIKANLQTGPVAWNMVVTIANPEDPINDASALWQGEHKTIIAARLDLQKVNSEANGKCDGINFDPLILTSGFEPSDDPILKARSPSYSVSFGRRLSEKANINK
ncbi:catalase family peroxidase [Endozoicomonas sp. SM1973]|uniref:Catalase-related peroxidase n=1 Tax=Spartinivicinus marinus TaxID=2994442 RepID=A0A853I6M7_9GAMM|nr:catalase family peroxidase [Spartinivicinus marinus]MCX4025781.1 catalase family peroxidase [Spartinivicinus marinus]NYZ65774.1 catalase family peroxidase [Spartinivicinus marinus]